MVLHVLSHYIYLTYKGNLMLTKSIWWFSLIQSVLALHILVRLLYNLCLEYYFHKFYTMYLDISLQFLYISQLIIYKSTFTHLIVTHTIF